MNHCKQTPDSLSTQSLTFIIHIIIFPISTQRAHKAIPHHSLQWTTSWQVSSHLFCLCFSCLFHAVILCNFMCITLILYYTYNDSGGFLQLLGQVSYGDVDHWMWRLYLDDFGEFCDSIGLPVCPYAELTPDDPLPPPTTLLYGISPQVIEKPQYWTER